MEVFMSVAKVTEITSMSTKSFEDAVEQGVAKASKTIRNIKSAWIQDQEAVVEDGRVTMFKVSMKLTFVID